MALASMGGQLIDRLDLDRPGVEPDHELDRQSDQQAAPDRRSDGIGVTSKAGWTR
jgi:hypothetical protein